MDYEKTPFFVTLQGRGLIRVEGPDARPFLQGLISNDVEKLTTGQIMYTCLLTPQGKFLHDFFMQLDGEAILIDCEGGARAQDLYSRLKKFTLRSKVTLSVQESSTVYAILNHHEGMDDPRHAQMGKRSFTKPSIAEQDFSAWDKHRITLGIPDGSRDIEIEKSTLIECNLDKLHAIDWNKGCYMGQELTARMHYRGLAKKHLYAVQFEGTAPPPFTDIVINDKLIGEMRSSVDHIGLALIKDDIAETLHDTDQIRLLG